MVSTDYTSGNPSISGTWNDLSASAVFSPGGWAWTASGYISLGVSDAGNVHIAFKYTSTNDESRTWEIDEVIVAGNTELGIGDTPAAVLTTAVYPNPSNGWFNAEMTKSGVYRITISNTQGSIVKMVETSAPAIKVETDSMKAGLYFVTITNKTSGLKEVHKLIVR